VKRSQRSGDQHEAQQSVDDVTSRDGTRIGFRKLGHGPGAVLLHGAASSGYNHIELARALSDHFTVYLPDRRGRGLSRGPEASAEDYDIQREVEDLEALLSNTGARNVFGVSSGAMIVLQAALSLPCIRKAAIYEPPFFIDAPDKPAAVLARFEEEMRQGKRAAAMTTGMKGAEMGPRLMIVMPRWLLVAVGKLAMRSEAKRGSGSYLSMRELADSMDSDFRLVVAMNDKLATYRDVRCRVLLMGGSRSPEYLRVALDALEQVLPSVGRVEFSGLNHASSWNRDRGGKPQAVAEELRRFFSEDAIGATEVTA